MSKLLQPALYSGKSLEQQWINHFYSSHDLICGCKNPVLHFLTIINKKGNAPKPEEDIKNILCLITGDPTTKEEEEPFGPGELDILFADDGDNADIDEKTTTTEDTG